MLTSKAKWEFVEKSDESIEESSGELHLSPIIQQLLLQRGMNTEESVERFLNPDLSALHNPEKLAMIDKASERIHQAIQSDEKILIFGDYDADGISSTTLLLKTLQELGANCNFYIPNRFTEGYGPNEDAFRNAAAEGFTVIITVDTGIASVHEASVAKELGIDLIITDHHELQEELPDAFAIINPKNAPDYPFQELAGVGVAFKLSQYLLGYFPEHLLDLVAIGTIADLVPLIDENRIFAYYGLQKLTRTSNIGLKALKRLCNIEDPVSENDVGFLIGPRLNATGRIKEASLAVELLMSEDEHEAEEIAEMIQLINEERQAIVQDIMVEAEQEVDTEDEESVIIVSKEGWNEGVLGIVASRLVQKYDRPTIVLTKKPDTNEVKGSARSIPAFNFFENAMKIKHLFTHFGGHSQAAGMTFPEENIVEIQEALNAQIKEQLTKDDFKQVIEVSQRVEIGDITEALISDISQLAPFGMGNPKPVFYLEGIPTDKRQIGSLKNHLKLQFSQEGIGLEAIGFRMGDCYPYIADQATVSIVGELGINEWNGIRKPQIILQDIAVNEWQLFDHRGKRDFDVLPYLVKGKSHLILRDDILDKTAQLIDNVEEINYDTELEQISQTDTLFIYDLPPSFTALEEILKRVKPSTIHVCFYVEDSTYLKAFPTREDFKWFYGMVIKRQKIDLKQEITSIMQAKSWAKERVIFIAQVFAELDFVQIEDGVVEPVSSPQKKDLQESLLYQKRLTQGEIEKDLYYSNYDRLKAWFDSSLY